MVNGAHPLTTDLMLLPGCHYIVRAATIAFLVHGQGSVPTPPGGALLAQMTFSKIPNKVRDMLGIMVDVNLREESGKEFLEIRVDPYPSPVSYKGQYHYRSGSTKQELKGPALSRFLLRKQGLHWDGVPLPGLALAECSAAALEWFRSRAAKSGRVDERVLGDGDAALLDSLLLVEGAYLKRATALLFGTKPERFVPGAYVKIGFFITDDDLRYQDEIHGDLFSQVERTLEILAVKYLKAFISYQGVQRLETFLFPLAALREAVLNAVVHKDVRVDGDLQSQSGALGCRLD